MTAITAHKAYLAEVLDRQSARRHLVDKDYQFAPQPEIKGYTPRPNDHINAETGPSKRHVVNYIEEEETVRNDLTERYVHSGEFGSNHIFGAGDKEICEEYPALRKLMDLKAVHADTHSHPPIILPLPSLTAASIQQAVSPTRFDVILLRPTGTWAETAALPIRNISSDPGFIFLWVGKGDDEGLEKGRECFVKWGFRRAEDIVWVKTNRGQTSGKDGEKGVRNGTGGEGLFASSKEHCLMGIRGTVRRSTDTRFVHCNVDTDILVWEQDEQDPDQAFPPYLYTLIENFCLGTRRLELFGDASKPRRGWVTATTTTTTPSALDDQARRTSTEAETGTKTITFDPTTYPALLPPSEVRPVLPFHPEIDQLRPKSPPRRGGGAGGVGGRGGAGGYQSLPNRPPRYQSQGQGQGHFPNQQQQPQHQAYQPGFHNQNQAEAQAQLHAQMQMQMQMQHAQMMAAMGMGGGMGVGMGMDPMMMAQMQAMAMAQGQGTGVGMGMEYQGGENRSAGMYSGIQPQGQFDNSGHWDAGQGQGQAGQGPQYPQYQHQYQYPQQQYPGAGWGWQQ